MDCNKDNEETIKQYIYRKAELKRIRPYPEICRVNIGMYKGNIERVKNKIKTVTNSINATKKSLESETDEKQKQAFRQKIEDFEKYMRSKENNLRKYENELANNPSLNEHSIAFITFKYESQAKAILESQGLTEDIKNIMSKVCPCCFKDHHFIERAPEPDDIRWYYIGYSDTQRFFSFLLSLFVTLLLVAASFGLQLLIRVWQNSLISTSGMTIETWFRTLKVQVLQALSAIALTAVNKLLVLATDLLSRKEKHMSESHFIAARTTKLVIATFLNSAVMPFAMFYFGYTLA